MLSSAVVLAMIVVTALIVVVGGVLLYAAKTRSVRRLRIWARLGKWFAFGVTIEQYENRAGRAVRPESRRTGRRRAATPNWTGHPAAAELGDHAGPGEQTPAPWRSPVGVWPALGRLVGSNATWLSAASWSDQTAMPALTEDCQMASASTISTPGANMPRHGGANGAVGEHPRSDRTVVDDQRGQTAQ